MASDREPDETAACSIRRAVAPLVSALSRAVFGVCAVAIGALILLLATGEGTTESTVVFVLLGAAALVVGFVTIVRLPKPPAGGEATRTAGTDAEGADD